MFVCPTLYIQSMTCVHVHVRGHHPLQRYIDKELSSLSTNDSERERYLNKLFGVYDRYMYSVGIKHLVGVAVL